MLPQSTQPATTGADHPPPLTKSTHEIALVSTEHSKITNVSVYSGRAEITRLFTFSVCTGQNQVTITGLPNVLDQDSLRVEGRGAVTIHDVAISLTPPRPPPSTSPALTALFAKKTRTTKALTRARKAISALEAYLGTLHVQHVGPGGVAQAVKEYEATAAGLDDRVLELEKELVEIEVEIKAEQSARVGEEQGKQNSLLCMRAVVGVFAEVEGEVEIALIYAVSHGASWTPGYDIRVDMHAKEEQVMLIYKAAITQNTGEDWKDVSLTLETATPTFGLRVPTLDSWPLTIYKPAPPVIIPASVPVMALAPAPSSALSRTLQRTARSSSSMGYSSNDGSPPPPPLPHVGYRTLDVSSKGNVSATFNVPGLITIPSDGNAHKVTIVQLKLNANMSWVCVPKKDTKVHLSAKIKNASQYTLLRGTGSVYVDGSFISRSEVPPVSPDESFDCPLGLDPSIRITYHPQTKKQSQSGFVTKTATHVFTRHITVHNTKALAVEGVRVFDHIPVSEDAQIQVNLVNPPLTRPSISSSSSSTSVAATVSVLGEARKPVSVGKGVTAAWVGPDSDEVASGTGEGEGGTAGVGKDGKIVWVCSVPAQGKVNVVLQWEVVVPAKTDIVGLMLAVCYA